jgi:hypothetical protein
MTDSVDQGVKKIIELIGPKPPKGMIPNSFVRINVTTETIDVVSGKRIGAPSETVTFEMEFDAEEDAAAFRQSVNKIISEVFPPSLETKDSKNVQIAKHRIELGTPEVTYFLSLRWTDRTDRKG